MEGNRDPLPALVLQVTGKSHLVIVCEAFGVPQKQLSQEPSALCTEGTEGVHSHWEKSDSRCRADLV